MRCSYASAFSTAVHEGKGAVGIPICDLIAPDFGYDFANYSLSFAFKRGFRFLAFVLFCSRLMRGQEA